MCSREIIYMFLNGQMSGLVKHFNTGIFSNTINVINVKLCMTVLHLQLYLFITVTGLDIVSRSEQCKAVFTISVQL